MARSAERSSGSYNAVMWEGTWKVISEGEQSQVELDIKRVILQTRSSGDTKPRKVTVHIEGPLSKATSARLDGEDDIWEEASIPRWDGKPLKII
jgi:hypothetical protein